VELFRYMLSKSRLKWHPRIMSIDNLIDSNFSKPEGEINEDLSSSLGSLNMPLGKFSLKGRLFSFEVKTERKKSHGHNCKMMLPSGRKGTELGDLILCVDYILDDPVEKRKITAGKASLVQTKRESSAIKDGLAANQLYLMTQWPEFKYKGNTCNFQVFSDSFAFYLFVLDQSQKQINKSSMLSASILARYLGENKASLLQNINGKVKFSTSDLILRDKNIQFFPLTIGFFLNRAIYLHLGSESLEVREFLKKVFFPSMEEVEDCEILVQPRQPLKTGLDMWPYKKYPSKEEGPDDDISAVRIRFILTRIE
jgi:hypothetical protein